MAQSGTRLRFAVGRFGCGVVALVALGALVGVGNAGDPPSAAPPGPLALSRQAAVLWTLQNNPELVALRQQHGVAASAVVIAETYPFNPVWEGWVRYAHGPEGQVLNTGPFEQLLLLEV